MKAAGINNGNWRGGYLRQFALDLRAIPQNNKPCAQDIRIANLKSLLRQIMGREAFLTFYKTTAFDGGMLELQLANEYINQVRAMIVKRRIEFIDRIQAANEREE